MIEIEAPVTGKTIFLTAGIYFQGPQDHFVVVVVVVVVVLVLDNYEKFLYFVTSWINMEHIR